MNFSGAKSKITPELVAAITAAVAIVLDKPMNAFQIKKITPIESSFSWAKVGVLELMASRQRFWK